MLALLTAELGFRLPKGSETQVGPPKMPLATGQVVFMGDPSPMADLCWLWPLSRDAPACPRGLQKLPRLERGGFFGEWRFVTCS